MVAHVVALPGERSRADIWVVLSCDEREKPIAYRLLAGRRALCRQIVLAEAVEARRGTPLPAVPVTRVWNLGGDAFRPERVAKLLKVGQHGLAAIARNSMAL